MMVLAIDASTKSSGFAVYENQELKHYGCITAGSTNVFKRIHKMVDELEKVLIEYKIDNVIIEDVTPQDVHENIQVHKTLTYLQGYILEMLDNHNIRPKFYTASEWRKKCGIHTGRGIRRESLKPKDIQFVRSQFGIQANDDVADAICIGFAAVGGVIKEPQVIIDDSGFEFA